MQQIETLEGGNFYHIYNRGINGEDLFREEDNYGYFLKLYDKHITPVADTYAWCLMKNHFHLLVKIKSTSKNLSGFEKLKNKNKTKPPHQHFSNLFNAYAKAINKRYNRHGSLFERPFKRKLIDTEEYLQSVVVYIHSNPVYHDFVDEITDWPWTSYSILLSSEPTNLKKDEVIEIFEDLENFKYIHQEKIDLIEIERFLDIDDL
ncbi:MAG: hypothetical protein GXO86_00310 [Chlorobi bacterium]|nr:hypothetical protein [Chlorobiota bacterium]